MIHNLSLNNSLLNQFVAELRDKNIQKDSLRFRKNLERIGEIFAYEISKVLTYKEVNVTTPLGVASTNLCDDNIVLSTILRAGMPMHNGMLNFFDKAENAFVSAYRRYSKSGDFNIKIDYLASPIIDDKVLIITDPMLASGSSMELSYKTLLQRGNPKQIHIVAIIASLEGIEYLNKHLPMDKIHLWVGAIDNELTAKSYIVPGLGDAGDLAYGSKLDVKDV